MLDLQIDVDLFEAKNRLVGIRICPMTLRLMDNFRELFGDHDSALIGLAIISIVSDRLTREELEAEFESLSIPMPLEKLAVCNISSISAATGFNRETTRRKIKRLIERGVVVRQGGGISLAPGFTQTQAMTDTVKRQVQQLIRTVNSLLRLGILQKGNEL